jgi:hypothetical protein
MADAGAESGARVSAVHIVVGLLIASLFAVAATAQVGPTATGNLGAPLQGPIHQQINTHLATAGPVPSVSSCGTGATIAGSDNDFLLVVGTGTSSCLVTYAAAWNSIPICTARSENVVGSFIGSRTTFNLTATLAGAVYNVHCIGQAGG